MPPNNKKAPEKSREFSLLFCYRFIYDFGINCKQESFRQQKKYSEKRDKKNLKKDYLMI